MPEESNFDSVSSYYDRLVRLVFGKSMMHAQSSFLNRIPKGSSVLVLGGGTGLWLNELLNWNHTCKLVYIDSSIKMIESAKRITNNSNRIEFRLGNENSVDAESQFDVVMVYCYLDLFTDSLLSELISTIRRSTTNHCQWIVVDFMSTAWWHRVMLFIMYNFFGITTGLANRKLPEWEQALGEANLKQMEGKFFYGEFIKSAVFVDTGK